MTYIKLCPVGWASCTQVSGFGVVASDDCGPPAGGRRPEAGGSTAWVRPHTPGVAGRARQAGSDRWLKSPTRSSHDLTSRLRIALASSNPTGADVCSWTMRKTWPLVLSTQVMRFCIARSSWPCAETLA